LLLRALWAVIFGGFALLASPAAGQQPQEAEVKAAFLYKFPAFVEWPAPARPDSPFIIALYGATEIAEDLARFAQGRDVQGHPIQVRILKEGEPPAGAQMVFVGRESARLVSIARSLAGTPVLIVSEAPGALEQGSMINLVVSDGRVRFEVAPQTAERNGLRISSRLLAVAQSVRSPKL
jgi:hypothetical protein